MRTFIGFTVFILFIGMAVSQHTENTLAWDRIGLEKVGHKAKNESISVDKDKRYRFIKLQVLETGIIIEKWILEYRNGTTRHVGFVGLVSADNDLPPIPVNAGLKKIHLRFYSVEKTKKARVEILGTL